MGQVYKRQQTQHQGSFASDLAALTIAGDAATGLGIVQNVQLSFSQSVARIYDVSNGGGSIASDDGTGNVVPVYYVGGRTNGQGTIARVLGPRSGVLCAFYAKMGDVCDPQNLTFTMRAQCEGNSSGAKVVYTIKDALMTNLGVSVGATDMIVNENVTLMFANLTCDDGSEGDIPLVGPA
jgi:hypothetical protein